MSIGSKINVWKACNIFCGREGKCFLCAVKQSKFVGQVRWPITRSSTSFTTSIAAVVCLGKDILEEFISLQVGFEFSFSSPRLFATPKQESSVNTII